jgi:hypothetical protein
VYTFEKNKVLIINVGLSALEHYVNELEAFFRAGLRQKKKKKITKIFIQLDEH